MVFVNSAEVAYDLFEKASSIYSDRGNAPMMNDLCVQQSVYSTLHRSEIEVHALGWDLIGISALCGMETGGGGTANSSIRNFTLLLLLSTTRFKQDKRSNSFFLNLSMHFSHNHLPRELLQRLHDTPSEFVEHLRHTAGAIIMDVRML